MGEGEEMHAAGMRDPLATHEGLRAWSPHLGVGCCVPLKLVGHARLTTTETMPMQPARRKSGL